MQKKRSVPRRRTVCITQESRLPQSSHLSMESVAVASDDGEVEVAVVGVVVDDGRFIVSVICDLGN